MISVETHKISSQNIKVNEQQTDQNNEEMKDEKQENQANSENI